MRAIVRITFLLLMTIGIEFDGGVGSDYRRFQHVSIAPFSMSEGTRIFYQFQNTYKDAATLVFRLSNTKYNQAIIFSQYYSRASLLTSSVAVPGYLMDGQRFTISLQATSAKFNLIQTLFVYPRQSYVINPVTQSTYNTPVSYLSTMNGLGVISYLKQTLTFNQFNKTQSFPTFGKYSLQSMTMRFPDEIPHELIVLKANLLVVDHPHFNSFSLQGQKRVIPLSLINLNGVYSFHFPSMFVHPKTLTIDNQPRSDYQQTNHLYFPFHLFNDLNGTFMTLEFQWIHIHQFALTYTFRYEGLQPLIGHCHQSLYCVIPSYA